jgi:hypothetical protein
MVFRLADIVTDKGSVPMTVTVALRAAGALGRAGVAGQRL